MSISWVEPLRNYQLYFQPTSNRLKEEWDGKIGLENVEDCLDWMELLKPIPCGDAWIKSGYKYNGASSGIVRHIPFISFPKWRHPIATARHDFRCDLVNKLAPANIITSKQARTLRKKADQLFKDDIAIGQTNKIRGWWEQTKGYIGVRLGALFNGNNW